MSQPDPPPRLAVYGTLRPGCSNHDQLDGLRGAWARGEVRGRLHADGWGAARGYPGVVLAEDGPAVPVEVFTSPDLPAHWARLDDFEGEGYRRVRVRVRTSGGCVEAFIYELAPGARPR